MLKTKKTVAERLFVFSNGKVDYERIIPLPDIEYDIYNCPKDLKGQLKIGDFR